MATKLVANPDNDVAMTDGGRQEKQDSGATANSNKQSYNVIKKIVKMEIDKRNGDAIGTPEGSAILESDKSWVIEEIYAEFGSQQISRHKLQFAPSWIIDKAFISKHDSNWTIAYTPVDEKSVPADANVVGSHVVYKVKTDEDGKKMKARTCPHGNEDAEKQDTRKDSAKDQLAVIRLMLSIVTFLAFFIKTADIKRAYLQIGPIKRQIYVRPPRKWFNGCNDNQGTLWKLIKLPYGIVEAGSQLMLAIGEWMLTNGRLGRNFGVNQLFIRRSGSGRIILLVAKLSDDFLVSGSPDDIGSFPKELHGRYALGKISKGPSHQFVACEIYLDRSRDITMSMNTYWKRIKPIKTTRTRRKMRAERATAHEVIQFQSLAGTLLYLGNNVLPQASVAVLFMQQRDGRFCISDLIEANQMLAELKHLELVITFRRVTNSTNVILCTFSDASHPCDR